MEKSNRRIRCKTSGNYRQFPARGEKNFKPSLTVPDQTMSLRELLHRHTRGLPLHHVERPTYYNEDETIDLKKLDLTEIQELKEQAAADILRLQDDAKAQIAAAKEKTAKKQRAQESTPAPSGSVSDAVGNGEGTGGNEKPSPPAMRHE